MPYTLHSNKFVAQQDADVYW